MNIFIDSDALFALNNEAEISHKVAQERLKTVFKETPTPYLSTNILIETITMISQRVGKAKAIILLEELRSGKYIVIHPSEDIVLQAEEIFKSIWSKNVSYSDCLSFAIMRSYGIQWVFSFDIHFKKQGFKRVGIDR